MSRVRRYLRRKLFFVAAVAIPTVWGIIALILRQLSLPTEIAVSVLPIVLLGSLLCIMFGLQTEVQKQATEAHRFSQRRRRNPRMHGFSKN